MIACSFCEKPKEAVTWIIAGPKESYICDECVDLCHEIVSEERVRASVRKQILEEMAKKEAEKPSNAGTIAFKNAQNSGTVTIDDRIKDVAAAPN